MATRQLFELLDTLKAQCLPLVDDDVTALVETADIQIARKAWEDRRTIFESLGEVLSALRVEIEDLRAAELRLRNWTRPAVALPDEVLARIFEEACGDATRVSWNPLPLRRHNIISTCSRWRQVGISTTALWHDISIATTMDDSEELAMLWSPDMLQLELERSSNRPLRLIFEHFEYSPRWLYGITESVGRRCGMIVANCGGFASWGASSVLGTMLEDTSPDILRILVLNFNQERHPGKVPETLDLTKTSGAKSLRLRCRRGFSDTNLPFLHFLHPPVWCVRRLSLAGCVDFSAAVGAINACQGLELLEWSYDARIRQLPELRGMMCTFRPQQSLVSLSLKGAIPLSCMQYLSAPNLVRLRVVSPAFDGYWTTSNHPLIHASRFAKLRHLETFPDPVLPPSVITSFLKAHPMLEVMSLPSFLLGREFVEALGVSEPTLPVLRDLWVDAVDPAIVRDLLRVQSPPFTVHALNVAGFETGSTRPGEPIGEWQNRLLIDAYVDEVWNWHVRRFW